MISDTESNETDSECDVNEIEAMLYSHIHHSVDWSCDDDITDNHAVKSKNPKVETLCIAALKDKPIEISNVQSTVNLSGGTMQQIPLVNKENVQRAANEDVIVLSSDDECEILDYCGIISKYNYQGAKENSTNVQKGVDRSTSKTKSRMEFKTISTVTNSTTSFTSGTSCAGNLYIHIDDEVLTGAEKIDVGSDADIVIISSSDDNVKSIGKRKRDDVLTSPSKRRMTASDPSRRFTEDEDCIIEIPAPVRKGDDWFICDGDRLNKTPNRRKDFHCRKLHIICHNCSQRGHITKTCPAPLKKIHCYICGDAGHHGDRCFRATCSVCWETGHSSTSCQQRKKISYKKCSVCQVPGHLDEHCPDFWRRYHLTIEPGKIVAPKSLLKSRDAISCCNCGQKGHFVHECNKKRMDVFVLPNRPDVATYNGLLPAPFNFEMQTQNNRNPKTFGKFKHWKKNFKQEARHAVSSIKQTFGKHFRFMNNSTSKFNRKKRSLMRNSVNDEDHRQNTQQTADNMTSSKQKRKEYWKNKLNRRNFNWRNSKWLEETNN